MRARLCVALSLLAAPAAPPSRCGRSVRPTRSSRSGRRPSACPPFDQIRTEHFLPAIEEGIAQHSREVAGDREEPGAAHLREHRRGARRLGPAASRRRASVFSNLTSAETSDALQAIQKQVAPMMAAHRDDIRLDPALFQRVKAVWDARARLTLDPDQEKLLEDTWKDFVRGGALLPKEGQERLRAINAELATLSVKFGDNLLKETNAYRLVIDKKEDLAGLPERVVAGGAEAAKKAGLEGKWLFTLQAPSLWPFLQGADEPRAAAADLHRVHDPRRPRRRDRQQGDPRPHRRPARGAGAAPRLQDPRRLRPRREHGEDAGARVRVPRPAVDAGQGGGGARGGRPAGGHPGGREGLRARALGLVATTRRRCARRASTSTSRRCGPTSPLDRVREGAFWVANRLYGITFTELPDLPVYNPEVKAFEVKDADGSHLAVFYVDYHPRAGQARGRLVEPLPRHLGREGRLDPPRGRQRLQLLPPRGRRAGAPLDRGGGDALPRVRARPRTRSCRRCATAASPRRRGTSSSCPRRSWRTGPPSPRCSSTTPGTGRPAR